MGARSRASTVLTKSAEIGNAAPDPSQPSSTETIEDTYVYPPLFGVSTMNHVINAHKVTTILVMGAACVAAGNYQLPAMIYAALHGAYGICWCMRYLTTPDKSFETKVNSVGEFSVAFTLLNILYWTGGLLMIATNGSNQIAGFTFGLPATSAALVSGGAYGVQVAVAVFIYAIGKHLTFVSDAQKFYTLKYQRPRKLVTDGMFSRSRNINYLGEMMIYTSFALVANNVVLPLTNMLMWCTVFRTNFIKKETSLSRYPEFEEYKARSNLLLPKLFMGSPSDQTKSD